MKNFLFFIVIFLSFNSYSQERKSDSVSIVIYVQFLVKEDGSIKRVRVPLVEGGESLSRRKIQLLKNEAMKQVEQIGEFDTSVEKQLYRMPFRFVFEEGYDF